MGKTRDTLLDLAVVIVILCSLTLTAITIHRGHVARSAPTTRPDVKPERLENWRDLSAVGHRIGPQDAEITVVVFSDFECPMCRTFALETWPAFEARNPGRATLVFRHWPLGQHRLARAAALAAECAAAQGRFAQFHDQVFAEQSRLGLEPLQNFARAAGVSDLAAFDACVSEERGAASIARDVEAVRHIGGLGTPTVVVNGWILRGGVAPALLDSISRLARLDQGR